ncbi:MAG TPA: DinB family protein [Vicinamibacterales bacterium]|nr:DinB family protein [Vicinamibacterales bacterium]
MKMIDVFLAEMEQEAISTRRVLERVPQAQLSWRPHARSMSLGQLALHVATIPGNVADMAAQTMPEVPAFPQPEVATAAELIPALAGSLARARAALGGMTDQQMMETWRMMAGGKEIVAMPRVAVVRTIMLNHWYHHRGQLLVYLRMHDVPLPSVYGPTADENPFAQTMASAN